MFAAKGLAGARVSEIAAQAGVNKQLISYYFGGKEGLYDAILEHWHEQEEQLAGPGTSLEEVVWRYLEVAIHQPDLQALFVRENLNQDLDDVEYEPDAPELVDFRARQRAGEIADELDPAFVLVALMSIVSSGTTLAGETKRLLGMDPSSPEYLDHAGEQLRRIVRRLGGPRRDL